MYAYPFPKDNTVRLQFIDIYAYNSQAKRITLTMDLQTPVLYGNQIL